MNRRCLHTHRKRESAREETAQVSKEMHVCHEHAEESLLVLQSETAKAQPRLLTLVIELINTNHLLTPGTHGELQLTVTLRAFCTRDRVGRKASRVHRDTTPE